MQVKVSARHTEVRKSDRALIVEKVERVGSKFLEMDRAEVHYSEQRNPKLADQKEVCEITFEGHGHHVRAKAAGPDHLTAVDLAIDKVENNLRKLKKKLSSHRDHRTTSRADLRATATTELPVDLVESVVGAPAEVGDDVEDGHRIVKTKKVERLVLSPIDASQRMDMLDHGFYFFTNVETNRAAVVYRRADGYVGLIDEEG